MKHISLITVLVLIITSSSNCKKGGLFDDKLPAATQEGKNTCGFLVNGKVWLPERGGFDYVSCDYDETYNGGTFNIHGVQYESGSNSKHTSFGIGGFDIKNVGVYKLNVHADKVASFTTSDPFCMYQWFDTIPNHNAFLNITKLDKINRIVSGTFEFALTRTGFETIIVTQGRFDMKF